MLYGLCKQPSKLFVAVTVLLWIVTLVINYFLGTNRILQAHAVKFSGGLCGACDTCAVSLASCSEWAGFDFTYLVVSLVLIGLSIGLYNGLRRTPFTKGITRVLFSAAGFIITTELLVQYLRIPVLYTHFMDGTQTLFYRFLLTPSSDYVELNVYLSFAILIFGVLGNLVGVLIHTTWHFLHKSFR